MDKGAYPTETIRAALTPLLENWTIRVEEEGRGNGNFLAVTESTNRNNYALEESESADAAISATSCRISLSDIGISSGVCVINPQESVGGMTAKEAA